MKSSVVKRMVIVSAIIIATLFLGEFIHLSIVEKNNLKVDLQISKLYYFFGFGTLFTYLLLEVGKIFTPNKILMVFIVALTMKMGAFLVLFFGGEMDIDTLSMSTRISIVIPLFLFVIMESILALIVLQQEDK
ncbi:hypothetical protein SAMN05216474_2379 [Lishizhenia tianjinensis]|uniref:Uncharacterized protein n=1 Tax=Lishizhenia tianjinensis TaxID=477690 RepID=A0A1I7AXQ2_9FLAO|nr:DUF6168 family protein [Lishizhenia tianjinensis]SFT79659.1 hypothetical protein SAMN05216474_2379 [Lishizhenia tianjinensis]